MLFDAAPPPKLAQEPLPVSCDSGGTQCHRSIHSLSASRPASQVESSPQLRFSASSGTDDASKPQLSGPVRFGSRGETVRWVQLQLRSHGFETGSVDGIFGAQTQAAVVQFQTQNDLSPDGIVGPDTWQQLQLLSAEQSQDASAASAVEVDKPLPRFSPSVLPTINFHAIGPAAETTTAPIPSYLIWLALISLATVGGTVYSSRQRDSNDSVSTPSAAYTPTPVYPRSQAPKEPAYETPASEEPAAVPSGPLEAIAAEIKQLGHHSTWAKPQVANHLESFVYDVLDPVGRHQLASHIYRQQVKPGQEIQAWLMRLMAFLPVPLHQVGVFPDVDSRTGQPYQYSLLDDLGGAFMMLRNELWMTRAAYRWLEEETPYVITVRQEDAYGTCLEKQYMIAIDPSEEPQRLPQASLA